MAKQNIYITVNFEENEITPISVDIAESEVIVFEALNYGIDGASGWSGYSGTSAWSGYSGTSAWSGYSGTSAWSGWSGYSGTSAWSGYSGTSAWSGWSGWSGYSGTSGVSGAFAGSGYSGYLPVFTGENSLSLSPLFSFDNINTSSSGYFTAKNIITDTTSNNIGLGTNLFKDDKGSTYCAAVGLNALNNSSGYLNIGIGILSFFRSNGNDNIGIGFTSLAEVKGNRNIGIGNSASNDVIGNNNVAVGNTSLGGHSGSDNIALGNSPLIQGSGTHNIVMGYWAGYRSRGDFNIGLGANSLNTQVGSCNVGVGHHTLYDARGDNNTALGGKAGYYISDGSHNYPLRDNLYLGASGRPLAVSGYNEIVIGAHTIGYGSNTVTLGNTDITKTILRGTVTMPVAQITTGAVSGYVFMSDAYGSGYWVNPSTVPGTSGYSGASGWSGYSGTSAWSGWSGYSGTSAWSGYSGTSGYSGEPVSTTGTSGYVPYFTSSTDITNSLIYYDDVNDRIGLGTDAPTQQLEITKNFAFPDNTSGSSGVIYKGGSPFIHTFHHPTGDTVVPYGGNTFIGENSGNFTFGNTTTYVYSGSRNTGIGYQTLMNLVGDASGNTAIGGNAGEAITTGYSNTLIGASAGQKITTSNGNTVIGAAAFLAATTGSLYNTAIGVSALGSCVGGDRNCAVGGLNTLQKLTTGSDNVAIGSQAGYGITTTNSGIFIGYKAGYYETGANTLIIDSLDRTTEALGRSSALIYGITNATPSSQILSLGGGGNVGIGTIAPTAQLHLVKADSSALTDFLINPTAKTSGNLIDAQVGGVSKFSVNYVGTVSLVNCDASNRVSSPKVKGALYTSTSQIFNIDSDNNAADTEYFAWSKHGETSIGTELMRLTEGGYLGIGTTAPDKKLEINSATGDCLRLTYNDSNGSATTKTDMTVDSSGELTITSPTDKTVVISPTVWEDLRIPVTSLKDAGVKPPGFTKFKDNGAGSTGVYAYWFDPDAEEELFFTVQLPHSWDGSAITPHIHWVPKTAATGKTVEWGFEYTWANIDGTYGNTNLIYTKTTTSGDADYVAGKHYMSNFAAITPGAGTQDGISSMMVCRVFRNATDATDDTYADDAGMLEVDFHYASDTLGSRTISSK